MLAGVVGRHRRVTNGGMAAARHVRGNGASQSRGSMLAHWRDAAVFVLTAAALCAVAVDIRHAGVPVLKWGFCC